MSTAQQEPTVAGQSNSEVLCEKVHAHFALAQHTEKFGILPNVSSLCSSSVVSVCHNEKKCQTNGKFDTQHRRYFK